MSEEPKRPNPIDIHVGGRVRLRRTMMGVSQEKLGEKLGITFQQVQKYEKGTNRIGASRLHEISTLLNTPVGFFFEDLPGNGTAINGFAETDSTNYVVDFLSTNEGLHLNRAFLNIKNPAVRKRVVDLVRSLAEEEDETSPPSE